MFLFVLSVRLHFSPCFRKERASSGESLSCRDSRPKRSPLRKSTLRCPSAITKLFRLLESSVLEIPSNEAISNVAPTVTATDKEIEARLGELGDERFVANPLPRISTL